MRTFYPVFYVVLVFGLSLAPLSGCASDAAPAGASDDDVTALDVRSALAHDRRAALLPTTSVAYVYRVGNMHAPNLQQSYTAPGVLVAEHTALQRDFKIKSGAPSWANCRFKEQGDYLVKLASAPTFLSKSMDDVNHLMGGPDPMFKPQQIASAKALEGTLKYKLVLTKELMTIYLGQVGSSWKVLGIDAAEYDCTAD